MPALNIFEDDAFSLISLSQTMTDLPIMPTNIGAMGLFREYGIDSDVMYIERQGSALKMIPATARGGVPVSTILDPNQMIPVRATYLPHKGDIWADQVLNARAFGSETEVETIEKIVKRVATKMKNEMEITKEHHRLGAIKGQVMDANGTTVLFDMYQIFGMTQQTIKFNIDNPASAADPKANSLALKRAVSAALGGRGYRYVQVFCSADFFDKSVGHDKMKKAWELWNAGQYGRENQNESDFIFADVHYKVISGQIGGVDVMPAGTAIAFPIGVPDMFQTAYAPGDFVDTVGSEGLPYYLQQKPKEWNRGIDLLGVSCPLYLNTLPEATIKLLSEA